MLAVRVLAVVAYLAFQASFLYFLAFVTGFVPARPAGEGLLAALAIDAGLVAFFGASHSLMARPGFKRWWTRIIPATGERSIYVLVASAQLALLCWQWRSLPGPALWSVEAPLSHVLLGLQLLGFAIALTSSFLIDHFELFGLRQAFGAPRAGSAFRTPLLYRLVRHPLYSGLLLALWAAPEMSPGRLVLAAGLTLYVLIGARLEERDLARVFGDRYRRYQREVPMLVPRPTARR